MSLSVLRNLLSDYWISAGFPETLAVAPTDKPIDSGIVMHATKAGLNMIGQHYLDHKWQIFVYLVICIM